MRLSNCLCCRCGLWQCVRVNCLLLITLVTQFAICAFLYHPARVCKPIDLHRRLETVHSRNAVTIETIDKPYQQRDGIVTSYIAENLFRKYLNFLLRSSKRQKNVCQTRTATKARNVRKREREMTMTSFLIAVISRRLLLLCTYFPTEPLQRISY